MIEILLQAERALTVGLLDQAERLYRQAAAADPQNSIAVVGLARVALERGDEPGAWRTSMTALEIDPENVAAQRLAGRLEEVWAYRGRSIAEAARATPAADAPAADAARAATASPAGDGAPTPDAAPAGDETPVESAAPAASPAPADPGASSAPSATRSTPASSVAAPDPTDPAHRGIVERLLRRNRA